MPGVAGVVRLSWAFVSDGALAACRVGVAAGGLVAAAAGVGVWWAAPVVMSPGTALVAVALAVPGASSLCVGAAGVGGTTAAMARWVRDGGWTAARASGHGGRSLLPGLVLLSVVVGAAAAACTVWVEPAARRASERVIAAAEGGTRLRSGEEHVFAGVSLRPTWVRGDTAGDVLVGLAAAVGSARTVEVRDGVLVARDGVLLGGDPVPWRLEFRAWTRAAPASARIPLAARSTSELAGVVARTEASGADASYERAVLWKRFLIPLSLSWLVVAAAPLGARPRPAAAAACLGIGWLVAVRLGDPLVAVAGAAGAWTGPVVAALAAWATWAAWRDA